LAERYFGEETTRTRWQEYLRYEADMLQNMTVRGDRMH
jgi:tRNA 2-(methylsulfanyl)-N6-isopentenyladenosine37 hydroxylase